MCNVGISIIYLLILMVIFITILLNNWIAEANLGFSLLLLGISIKITIGITFTISIAISITINITNIIFILLTML